MSSHVLAALCGLLYVFAAPTPSFADLCTPSQQGTPLCRGARVLYLGTQWRDGYIEGFAFGVNPTSGEVTVRVGDPRTPNNTRGFVTTGKDLSVSIDKIDGFSPGFEVVDHSNRWRGGYVTGIIRGLYEDKSAIIEIQDARTPGRSGFFRAPLVELMITNENPEPRQPPAPVPGRRTVIRSGH